MEEITLVLPKKDRNDEHVPTRLRKVSTSLLADRDTVDKLGRIYYTYAPSADGKHFTFVTTHKDTHLRLGLLRFATLRDIGEYLEWRFRKYGTERAVVRVDPSDVFSWHVIRTEENKREVFFYFLPIN